MKNSKLDKNSLLELNNYDFLLHISEHCISEKDIYGYVLNLGKNISTLQNFIVEINEFIEESFNLIWGSDVEFKMGELTIYRLRELVTKRIAELEKEKDSQKNTGYKIAGNRKTDFVKIISAMYECRIFETTGGQFASNKDSLIKALGTFLNTEINNSSRILSDAKNTGTYTDIFDTLKDNAEKYYLDNGKNKKA